MHGWGIVCKTDGINWQLYLCRAWISDCIPQYSVRCNYLSIPYIITHQWTYCRLHENTPARRLDQCKNAMAGVGPQLIPLWYWHLSPKWPAFTQEFMWRLHCSLKKTNKKTEFRNKIFSCILWLKWNYVYIKYANINEDNANAIEDDNICPMSCTCAT